MKKTLFFLIFLSALTIFVPLKTYARDEIDAFGIVNGGTFTNTSLCNLDDLGSSYGLSLGGTYQKFSSNKILNNFSITASFNGNAAYTNKYFMVDILNTTTSPRSLLCQATTTANRFDIGTFKVTGCNLNANTEYWAWFHSSCTPASTFSMAGGNVCKLISSNSGHNNLYGCAQNAGSGYQLTGNRDIVFYSSSTATACPTCGNKFFIGHISQHDIIVPIIVVSIMVGLIYLLYVYPERFPLHK